MKLKLLVKLGELILGKAYPDDEPRADMFLPVRLLAFAIVLLIGAIVFAVLSVFFFSIIMLAITLLLLVLGAAALLCWRNQTIRILSDDCFEYTTFLGNKKQYRFSEVTGLIQNNDSMTLIARNERIHIESSAILSKRLIDRLGQALSDQSRK